MNYKDIYVDHGCELRPKCLECDLPTCQYDEQKGKEIQTRGRAPVSEIMEMFGKGFNQTEIAKAFDVSTATIRRREKEA